MPTMNPKSKNSGLKSKHKITPTSLVDSKDDISELLPIDVIEILHQDHARVDNLFFQYRFLQENKDKKQLVEEILKELYVHATVEEELVYPQIRKSSEEEDVQDVMDEADTEHHVAKVVMGELAVMKPSDDHYDAKVTVLCELIKHHVGEEEKEMFKKLKESEIDLEKLGEEVLKRKKELEQESAASGIAKIWKELKEFKAL